MAYPEIIHPITVGALNTYLKEKIEADDALKTVCVEGEISNLTIHTSGHIYFTLKDTSAAIRAVMFRGYRASLKFIPANGMHVLLIADVALYERSGSVQLYVQRMMQSGVGEIYYQFEQLKQQLEEEGLFDASHKQPLPKYPERICIVTSPTGAALQDMKNVLRRRFPMAEVLLCPATVQGAEAAPTIVQALQQADVSGADIILLARGGGSAEDLYVFNDEHIARAIYAAKTPIVTGIGHETDFTIADFAADLRAPTPSAAAELAVPNVQDLLMDLLQAENKLQTQMALQLQQYETKLEDAQTLLSQTLSTTLSNAALRLHGQQQALRMAMTQTLQQAQHKLQLSAAQLRACDPLAVYQKGFGALADAAGKRVRSVTQLEPGEILHVTVTDGTYTTTITHKECRK